MYGMGIANYVIPSAKGQPNKANRTELESSVNFEIDLACEIWQVGVVLVLAFPIGTFAGVAKDYDH